MYNLTRTVDTLSLRVCEGDQPLEAADAGNGGRLTDHIWTIKDLLMTVVPPSVLNT